MPGVTHQAVDLDPSRRHPRQGSCHEEWRSAVPCLTGAGRRGMIHWVFSPTDLGQWCNRIHLNGLEEAIGPRRLVLLSHQQQSSPNVLSGN